jgi:hypothetical protein
MDLKLWKHSLRLFEADYQWRTKTWAAIVPLNDPRIAPSEL